MSGKGIHLDKRAWVNQLCYALASRHLPRSVAFIDGCLGCGFGSFYRASLEISDLSGRGTNIISHSTTVLAKGRLLIRLALDQKKIASYLSDSYWRVKVFDEVTSTQSLLRDAQPSHGDLYIAEYQSQGRGRLNRTFEATAGTSLLFSFYVKLERDRSDWGWVPLLVGSALAEEINFQTNSKNYSTKWPNDVIAPSGKIAGILSEAYGSGILVGVGINVLTTKSELPVATASSIALESKVELDRNEFLSALLMRISDLLATWEEGANIASRYLDSNSTVGNKVLVQRPNAEDLEAIATGINSDGGLILDTGEVITVGDINHLR